MVKKSFIISVFVWLIAVVLVWTSPSLEASKMGILLAFSLVVQVFILTKKNPLVGMLLFQIIWMAFVILVMKTAEYKGVSIANVAVFQIPSVILMLFGVFKRS